MTEIKKAGRILANRRKKARENLEKRLVELEREFPDYFNLKRKRDALGVEMIRDRLVHEKNNTHLYLKEIKSLDEKMKIFLEENRINPKELKIQYNCSLCKDRGEVLGKMCSCKEQLITNLRYHSSELEEKLEDENFETFNLEIFQGTAKKLMSSYYEEMKKYSEEFQPGISSSYFFTGPVGTGKTFLCSAIAKELLDQGFTVIYKTAASVIKEIRDYHFAPFGKEEEYRERYKDLLEVDLLILDDLGTEHSNDLSISYLFNLLNERMIRKKALIISSNLSLEDIKKHYDQRIHSRIVGSFETLVFTGKDLRLAQKGF